MVHLSAAALLAARLLASVSAGSVQHQAHAHLHHRDSPAKYAAKSDVPAELKPGANATTCGCTTYTTTWYGEPTLYFHLPPSTTSSSTSLAANPTHPAADSSPPKPASPVNNAPPAASANGAPPAYSPPKPATPAAPASNAPPAYGPPAQHDQPKPAPPAAGSDTPASSGGITPNGNQWAMAYTPYRQDGGCKTADEVNSDIASIKSKGFGTVRIYAPDCNGPENVGNACKASGMKMIIGIFIDGQGLGAAHDQAQALVTWGQSNGNWDMVSMVVAGNEAIFGGFVSAQDMADFIDAIKPLFKGAGYNGPITTTEPLNIMQENGATLCPCIDVVAANLHSYFNGQYDAAHAGDLVAQQLKDLAAVCGGSKEAYNLETGWPSQGQPNGIAVASPDAQKQAIESIIAAVGSKSVILSFENDMWKAPGDYGIEQYWGCSQLFDGN